MTDKVSRLTFGDGNNKDNEDLRTFKRRVTKVFLAESSDDFTSRTPRRSIFIRRRSLFSSVGSIKQTSTPSLLFEPSYRLAPAFEFPVNHIESILRSIVVQKFKSYTEYNAKKFNRDCQRVTILTVTRIKEMHCDRYRIVCIIASGEKFYQDVNYKTGFLWDTERDKWATYVYERPNFYVCAAVYGIYYD